MQAALVFSEELARYEYGKDHPFKPVRAKKMLELCERYNLLDRPGTALVPPEGASGVELCRFHTSTYVAALEKVSRGIFEPEMLAYGLGTEDNPVLPNLLDWCSGTVGGTLTGLALFQRGYHRVFHPLGGFHRQPDLPASG